MISRAALVAALLASAGPALLFSPVFGIAPLLLPLALIVVSGFAVAEACRHWPALVPWRALLTLLVGLLAIVEALLFPTTATGLPTAGTVSALAAGLTDSWQLTLQSTWPARADPELLLFVPLAALAATALAVELLARLRRPLVALLPGLAVLALSQAYVALTGLTAMLAAFGFAAVAAVLLSSSADEERVARPRRRLALLLVVPTLVLSVGGALLGVAVDPTGRSAYSLRDKQFAPLPPERVASPLDELTEHLLAPEDAVLTYSTDAPVDRWRLVVLDQFDGVTWTPSVRPRRFGTALPSAPAVTVPTTEHSAHIEYADAAGPWLPSQAMPASVSGLAPLVDEISGTLLAPGHGPVSYDLSWWEPTVRADVLGGAGIDPTARTGFGDLGHMPDGIAELAGKAVQDTRPAFQTALVLERYLREHYTLATGADLPSGSGWPQLRTFLLDTRRGTTEQFAAAYVVLARKIGLPARIAVGYRASGAGDDVVVHSGDVLAWPEVAVEGVGWVPLDPAGTPSGSGVRPKGLAEVTAQARENLPPPEKLRDPELRTDAAADENAGGGDGFALPVAEVLTGFAALVVIWVLGVPLARFGRGRLRRRRPGARAVVGAWAEARDRLRAHGIPYTAGMTVRDLAGAATRHVDRSVVTGLHSLARTVDVALWSRTGPAPTTVDEAWSAVREVRRGLSRRPWPARLRAALSVRGLF
ncbi:transglutaminase-like domain-containing protein [Actinophytocola sp.]|uniref:transglutaminase-like domain-containing protein n=1 Tax=Actinophytocola sp. TaxID=1872138 RepID=UPI002D2CE1B5|nr:transglutaminase-like domain-containing protein [Actinophytocola sp.]HYQ68811.1 transglutaminase-like domain-containing protein [Actinophytocola sp.]